MHLNNLSVNAATRNSIFKKYFSVCNKTMYAIFVSLIYIVMMQITKDNLCLYIASMDIRHV